MKSGIRSVVLAGLLARAGFASFAQTATPTPTQPEPARPLNATGNGIARQDGNRDMHGQRDPAAREAMVARRLADLKARLNITAEQEGAWTRFTTAMKPPTRMEHHQRPDPAEMDKLTTPERIDKMRALRAQHMADQTAAMDRRAEAAKAFYAALNADQKKIFDAEHARMGHHHGGHAGGKRRGDGPAPN